MILNPDWFVAFKLAVESMATDMLDLLAAVAPVALPVGGAYLAIRRGWRSAKGLTR